MLLCGFESFDQFFVRIDILERLFIKIMNLNNEKKDEIKLVPEMLNLLGCNKDNFLNLIKKMNYKYFEKDNETFFKYAPQNKSKKKHFVGNKKKDNPFNVLKEISFKNV